MNGYLLAGACGVLFALSADVGVSQLVDVSRADIESYYEQWQSSGLRTYDMSFQWICNCEECFVLEKTVTVTDNEVTDVAFADSGNCDECRPASDYLLPSQYASVCELFEILLDSVDTAFSTQVEFDEELPYPKRAYIDHEVLVADEETAWTITDLTYQTGDLDFEHEACADSGTTEGTAAPSEQPTEEPTRRRRRKKNKNKKSKKSKSKSKNGNGWYH